MTLDDTGEALALAHASDVDLDNVFESRDRDGLADGMLGSILDAHLAQGAHRSDARLVEVALHGLVDFLFLDVTETDLDGLVAVGLGGLYLRDNAGAGLDDRDGDDVVIFSPDLSHTQLAAENRIDHFQPNLQAILSRLPFVTLQRIAA